MTDIMRHADSRVVSRSSEDLRTGLAGVCEGGDHWCCREDFLKQCSLSKEHLQGELKQWWGNPDLWLDMLATEIARAVGLRVGIEQDLGQMWLKAVDAWTDAAYAEATANMSCPPQRPMLSAKAAPLATRVLESIGSLTRKTKRSFCLQKAVSIKCDKCDECYSQRLVKCPVCFPPAPAPRSRRTSVDKQIEWQKCASLPLDGIDWSEATDVTWCHGGSGGIMLVKLPAGAVGIKRMKPEELFAQRLAAALGVRVAALRPLGPQDDETGTLRQCLQKLAPAVCDDNWLQVRKILSYPYLSLVEFVDGFGMMGIQAHNHLLQARTDNSSHWFELGRLMAFDMLINNFDRVPLAWMNDGNLANVMLGSRLGSVVGIDQAVAPITHKQGMLTYLQRIQRTVLEVRKEELGVLAAVKNAIYVNTAVELSTDEIRRLCDGCIDFVEHAVRQAGDGQLSGQLAEIADEVSCAFVQCNPRPTEDGALGPVSGLMQSCCNMSEQVIAALTESLV